MVTETGGIGFATVFRQTCSESNRRIDIEPVPHSDCFSEPCLKPYTTSSVVPIVARLLAFATVGLYASY